MSECQGGRGKRKFLQRSVYEQKQARKLKEATKKLKEAKKAQGGAVTPLAPPKRIHDE